MIGSGGSMRFRRLWLVGLLVAVAACSSRRHVEEPGFGNGTRLGVRYDEIAGTRVLRAFYDTARDEECAFQLLPDGAACLPQTALLDGWFADAACSEALVHIPRVAAGRALPIVVGDVHRPPARLTVADRHAAGPLVVPLVVGEQVEARAVIGNEHDGAEEIRDRLDARRGVDEAIERHLVADPPQHDRGVRRVLHAAAVGLQVVRLGGRDDVAERAHGGRSVAGVGGVGDERARRRATGRHARDVDERHAATGVGEPAVERPRLRKAGGAAGDQLKRALLVAGGVVEGAQHASPGELVIAHAEAGAVGEAGLLHVSARGARRNGDQQTDEPQPAKTHATGRSYHAGSAVGVGPGVGTSGRNRRAGRTIERWERAPPASGSSATP
ncbi:MAG: hypothetical protein ACXVDD_08240 [Polyangia bacterium]